MLRTVYLYGHLAEQFGHEHRLDVVSFPEACRAFMVQIPEFKSELSKGSYELVYGKWLDSGERVPKDCLQLEFHDDVPFHIHPVLEGEGGDNKGLLSIILGVALVAIAFIVPAVLGVGMGTAIGGIGAAGLTWGKLAMIGGMLALGGIAKMLSPTPEVAKYEEREEPEKRTSFLLNGPVNRMEQGGPIPVIMGDVIVGSVVVSASYIAENYVSADETGGSPPVLVGTWSELVTT